MKEYASTFKSNKEVGSSRIFSMDLNSIENLRRYMVKKSLQTNFHRLRVEVENKSKRNLVY